jgi:hypothetical protein
MTLFTITSMSNNVSNSSPDNSIVVAKKARRFYSSDSMQAAVQAVQVGQVSQVLLSEFNIRLY